MGSSELLDRALPSPLSCLCVCADVCGCVQLAFALALLYFRAFNYQPSSLFDVVLLYSSGCWCGVEINQLINQLGGGGD